MKTLLINAKVYVEKGKFESAVLVEDGIISFVGADEEAMANAGDDVTIIDCSGNTLVPGFNDSHMHLFGLAKKLSQVSMDDLESVEHMVQRCREYMTANPAEVKHGLYAAGWNQDYFSEEKRMPEKADLDKVSGEIPVCLERTCGHIIAGNSVLVKMLEGSGMALTEEERERGIFREEACKKARSVIPDPGKELLSEMVLDAMNRCASFGVTSVQSNDAEFVFSDHELVEGALEILYGEGKAQVRYRHQISYGSPEFFAEDVERGTFEKDTCSPMYTNGPLKLFTDGSLGARTAHMKNGYADDPGNFGLETITAEELESYCRMALDRGLQVVTHGIGDGAVKKIVDVYEKLIGSENHLRWGIIHCQITDKELVARIRDLNIPTFVQPIFLDYDITMADSRCGEELASTSYAFKTLFENGHMAFGTDCPVEDCNPFNGIYCAVTRKRLDGTPEGGWNAHEAMDIFDAVDAYTIEGAYMEFAEDRKGRIRPGYVADMVLLDEDIFTVPVDEIKDIRPLITITGGVVVYKKPA